MYILLDTAREPFLCRADGPIIAHDNFSSFSGKLLILLIFKGPHEMNTTTWQKWIVFNLIFDIRMCFSSILIHY